MPLTIGEVTTFANPKADKAQVMKIGEECMEVFSAWENLCKDDANGELCGGHCPHEFRTCSLVNKVISEIADTIQACANLAAALGVDDMRGAMAECEARNRERGRL